LIVSATLTVKRLEASLLQESEREAIAVLLLLYVGGLVAFIASERVIRAQFRQDKLSPQEAYYLLARLQGVYLALPVVVAFAISTNLPRSHPLIFVLGSLIFILVFVLSMVMLARLMVRIRRIDIDRFISRRYR
jgi:hypothetical protein